MEEPIRLSQVANSFGFFGLNEPAPTKADVESLKRIAADKLNRQMIRFGRRHKDRATCGGGIQLSEALMIWRAAEARVELNNSIESCDDFDGSFRIDSRLSNLTVKVEVSSIEGSLHIVGMWFYLRLVGTGSTKYRWEKVHGALQDFQYDFGDCLLKQAA